MPGGAREMPLPGDDFRRFHQAVFELFQLLIR
jgi:hypothetical protein